MNESIHQPIVYPMVSCQQQHSQCIKPQHTSFIVVTRLQVNKLSLHLKNYCHETVFKCILFIPQNYIGTFGTWLRHSVYCDTFSFSYWTCLAWLCYLNQTACIIAWEGIFFKQHFGGVYFATVPADYKREISLKEKVNIWYSQVCHSWEHDYREWELQLANMFKVS